MTGFIDPSIRAARKKDQQRNRPSKGTAMGSSPATETLLPCPFCAGPAVNVGGEYITCGAAWKHDCAGHQLRCLPCDWNTRPVEAATTPSPVDVDAVALAIEETMFAPHELPVDADLHSKYRGTAIAAIKAMNRIPHDAQAAPDRVAVARALCRQYELDDGFSEEQADRAATSDMHRNFLKAADAAIAACSISSTDRGGK